MSGQRKQVQQGVGEGNIVLQDEFIGFEHVLFELGADLGEVIRHSSLGSKDHVEEVGRAARHATADRMA